MSMFDNLGTDKAIKEEKDSLGGGGFGPIDSGLYPMKIKMAYMSLSAGGATAMNLVLVNEDKKEVKDVQWMTSGKEKGCKNYYMKKEKGKETGEKAYLPGFNAINNLCLLTAGKEIADLGDTVEKKTIMLYDYTAGEELPKEVDMVMALVGQEVLAGVIHAIVDKRAKNDQTGKYEATGETRTVNEVDKYFRASDGMTVTEIRSKAEEAVFKDQWSEKWTGQVKEAFDKKAVQNAGTQGAPAASGTDAPKASLFN